MSARDLAATVEEFISHYGLPNARAQARTALAALKKQADDAQERTEILSESNRALQRSATLNRDGRKTAEARALRAEEALRQIRDGIWNRGRERDLTPREFAREALAAAGADTEQGA